MKCPVEITSAHLAYDRSRTTTDWDCPRKRYWNYEHEGVGLAPEVDAVELFTGIVVHDAMSAIAKAEQVRKAEVASIAGKGPGAAVILTPVPIDTIAEAAAAKIFDYHCPEDLKNVDSVVTYAKEQAALIYGMLKGFHQHTWPKLMDKYDIVCVEEEMFFIHDQHGKGDLKAFFVMMVKPDLVLRDKTSGELVYLEYKTTNSKKEGWIAQWEDAVQVHSTLNAIEQTFGERPVYTIVQGLYKGYCLAPSTPVLTTDLRWVPAGELKEGDHIAGFEEEPRQRKNGHKKLRQWQDAVVTRTGRAILPSYKITFEDGSVITCSANHKWLTTWKDKSGSGRAQWTTTEDLRTGHNASRVIKAIQPWSNEQSNDMAYLGGILDGEGHFVHGKLSDYDTTVFGFSQKPGAVLDKTRKILADNGFTKTWEAVDKKSGVVALHLGARTDIMRCLGMARPVRLLPKLNFDRLGGMNNVCDPVKVVSKEFVGEQEVVTLETSTGTLIANGFASHNSSYGKQSSPFCYGYSQNGQPPFFKPTLSYEYRNGLRRVATWELEGGTKKWVENMPASILADQYPQTPPIFCNQDLITDYFQQRAMRELEIQMAKQMLEAGVDSKVTLNGAFPQRFDRCKIPTTPPRLCAFRLLCHGHCTDPLKAGYAKRQPHHELEISQIAKAQEELREGQLAVEQTPEASSQEG